MNEIPKGEPLFKMHANKDSYPSVLIPNWRCRMRHSFVIRLLVLLLAVNLVSCGDKATLPEEAGFGPNPKLPPPNPTLIPYRQCCPGQKLAFRYNAKGSALAFR